jgi:hypothetical protein
MKTRTQSTRLTQPVLLRSRRPWILQPEAFPPRLGRDSRARFPFLPLFLFKWSRMRCMMHRSWNFVVSASVAGECESLVTCTVRTLERASVAVSIIRLASCIFLLHICDKYMHTLMYEMYHIPGRRQEQSLNSKSTKLALHLHTMYARWAGTFTHMIRTINIFPQSAPNSAAVSVSFPPNLLPKACVMYTCRMSVRGKNAWRQGKRRRLLHVCMCVCTLMIYCTCTESESKRA